MEIPGLEVLIPLDCVSIHHVLNLKDLMSQSHIYEMKDTKEELIFKAEEESMDMSGLLLGCKRDWTINVGNCVGEQVMRVIHPYQSWTGSFLPSDKCAETCTIEAPPGYIESFTEILSRIQLQIGRVQQKSTLFSAGFHIFSAEGEELVTINPTLGGIKFSITKTDGNGGKHEVGEIKKKYGGLLTNGMADMDDFRVVFDQDLDPKLKGLLLGATIASVEERYAKELQGLIECFSGSRVDLPVKKLEELAKAKLRTARRLKKVEDKRGELYTLWKLCNIYSITAVEVDEAMRETRGSLRKRIKATTKDPSPFRRLVDEYRPANKREQPQDIYDSHRPNLKENRFLDLFKKKDTRKVGAQNAEQSYTQNLVEAVKANYRSTEDKKSILPPKPPSISSVTSIPSEPTAMPPIPPTDRITAQQATQAVQEGYTPIVKTRTDSKEKVEEAKRLSMPVLTVTERQAQLPPTAPPRKDRKEDVTNIKRASPALPPRPKTDVWKKTDMNRVPPTVIQLDGKVPINPPQVARKSDHATNIQVEDIGNCSPPSPSTTIHVGSDVAVAMSPKVSNERVQRLQPESVRARPVQQAQIVNISGEKQTVDRF